jgi:glycosyltransferase involved in cell wall biosynthesis
VYARLVLHYIRLWDLRTANGVDKFIANSQFIARRIRKVYKRDALVVHPPVDVQAFLLERDKEDYYITASRLVPYKKVELIVSAFAQMPNRKLIVVGEGPGLHQCRSLATKNISFLGHQAPDKLIRLLCKAKAFVFAAEEDFGITLVEAQACGTPVIAYGKGGALDSVVPDKTGIFFHAQTPQSIVSAVERFASGAVTLLPAADIRRHSLQFDKAEFRSKMTKIIAEAWLGLLRDMREGAYFPGDQDSHRDAAVAFRAVAQ